MEIKELLRKAVITKKDEKDRIRNFYCSSFFDIESEGYIEEIEKMHKYLDGYCYNGYLWDYLSRPEIIEELCLIEKIREVAEVYILWDIHSCEKIFIEDYWKFEKDDILLLSGNLLVETLDIFPEDVYIFDASFTWTMILTHEYSENKRYCLKSTANIG